jgi:hypothetical protein
MQKKKKTQYAKKNKETPVFWGFQIFGEVSSV